MMSGSAPWKQLCVAVLGATAIAVPVAANELSDAEVRKITVTYADCAIARYPQLTREFIVSNVGETELLRSKYRKLINGVCLNHATKTEGGRMTFPSGLYRYALAGALVRTQYASGSVKDLSAVSALSHFVAPPFDESKFPKGKKAAEKARKEYAGAAMWAFISPYGECVVRAKPETVHALLTSEPATAIESAAFKELHPVLEKCMPDGATLKFGREVLRGALAVNYARLADAASKLPAPAVVESDPDA